MAGLRSVVVRIVAWNCCGGFGSKRAALAAIGCDAAIVAEAYDRAPEPSLLEPGPTWGWNGLSGSKGLALVGLNVPIVTEPLRPQTGRYSIAGTLDSGIGLLGIWSVKPEGSSYGQQVVDAISGYEDWLTDLPGLVAGDFNLAPNGIEDSRTGVLRRVFDHLARLDYVSIYHEHFDEDYGSETRPTYFHRRRQAEAHHIDFCFIHRSLVPRVRGFEVGTYDRWVARREPSAGLSDHVPLILDLD